MFYIYEDISLVSVEIWKLCRTLCKSSKRLDEASDEWHRRVSSAAVLNNLYKNMGGEAIEIVK